MPLSLVGKDPETAFYAEKVARFGGPVLLLGSADGQLAFSLASRGERVVAVEPSEFLMAEAEARKAEAPAAQVELVRADLRTVRVGGHFKTVLAPKNALALARGVDGLDAVLETVTRHLEPGGAFVFEVSGLKGSAAVEGPLGRSLFTAHLRERKGAQAIRRIRRTTLTPEDLEVALAASGLEAHEMFLDFEGHPYVEGEDRQIVIALRRP
jgi:SAM-dependent methyltransferase